MKITSIGGWGGARTYHHLSNFKQEDMGENYQNRGFLGRSFRIPTPFITPVAMNSNFTLLILQTLHLALTRALKIQLLSLNNIDIKIQNLDPARKVRLFLDFRN